MRKAVALPVAIGFGAIAVIPRLFKRAWRPPQREVHRSPADLGLEEEQVWLTNDKGVKLHGWFVPVEADAPCAIVLHGWGGNAAHMLDIAPVLNAAGFHSLFLDARNHGLSEHDDHVSMLRFAEDLGVAVKHLNRREDVTEVVVVGHSVGAAATIYYASHNDDISAVVAVASFTHPGEFMDEYLSFPRPIRWGVLRLIEVMIGKRFDDIAPRSRIKHVRIPLLLVHGDKDDVVPIENSYELRNLLPTAEFVVVPEGEHSDLTAFEPFFDEVTGFLRGSLKG